MTLSDALVRMAPPDQQLSPVEDAQRQAAIEQVYAALGTLGRRVVPASHRDDVVDDVLVRLMKNRPGARRYTASDGEATAYLITALKNRYRDEIGRSAGRGARLVSLTAGDDDRDDRDLPDTAPRVDDTLIGDERRVAGERLLVEADQVLYEQAIPAIARTLREGDGFIANVRDIRAIARETTSIEELVAREQRDGDTFVRTRNRIYQRQKRTRGYLLEVPRHRPSDVPRLSAWLAEASLRHDLDEAVRNIARQDFAPRVQHGDPSLLPHQARTP